MPLLTWQLWLAKDLVRETCLRQAKTALSIDAWKGRTINASTFNQDWDSGCCPQTARKVGRMAYRKTSDSKMSVSCG